MPDQKPEVIATENMKISIAEFNNPLGEFVKTLGLPIENILAPHDQRKFVINSLYEVIEKLPIEQRNKSHYLTKFTVAISVGLFDGALNYLWDETVKSLRGIVSKFDLEYFYFVAEQVSLRAKGLKTAEDLAAIDEHDLLETCRRIGLLSEVNHKRLSHINYMRNHASAAHPNDNIVNGPELISWLTNCLDSVIMAQPDHSIIMMTQLLNNVRNHEIPVTDLPTIGAEIQKMQSQRIDDLLSTIVGMYCDPRVQNPNIKLNVEGISKYVWDCSSVERKYSVGLKVGSYIKVGDVPRKDALERFLGIVNGNSYKDEDVLTTELLAKLGNLRSAHYAHNNFYNEQPHAENLILSMPLNGRSPKNIRTLLVKIITICHLGNGLGYREGVDENADVIYKQIINKFEDIEILEMFKLFNDPEFINRLWINKPHSRFKKMAAQLCNQCVNIHLKNALYYLGNNNWNMTTLATDKTFQDFYGNLGAIRL